MSSSRKTAMSVAPRIWYRYKMKYIVRLMIVSMTGTHTFLTEFLCSDSDVR